MTVPEVWADVGHSLREAGFMAWDTLWALVLGFALSGAVQAFVPRDTVRRKLGDHRPASVVRASAYGMASSSCSYAASAMARSLVAGGADMVTSMVFMVASTNLVVELGIVLAVLIGWQFVAAEAVGGIIMIGLLAVLGGLWLRGRALAGARARVERSSAAGPADGQPAGRSAPPGPALGDHQPATGRSGRQRLRTAAGWADAAGYMLGDLTMLRRELVLGFVAAGFLTELVPAHVWADAFLRGHGVWTTVENAVVGPLVALVSCVCSVGNVPLAAALWHGGVAFAGVVAFVFADLVSLPLLLVYRRQYGGRMALRLLALFWVVMSAAGLVTEALFRAAGWVPTARPGAVVGDTVHWDATTVLDLVALAGLAGLWMLHHRHHRRSGGSGRTATDPVCGMQVESAQAPARTTHAGRPVVFCSERCAARFAADPDRYLPPVRRRARPRPS